MTFFEILLKNMTIKSLDRQFKLLTLMMVHDEIWARGNAPIYCNKSTDISTQNLKSCWSYSGPYCQSNKESGNETYAGHLIFLQ